MTATTMLLCVMLMCVLLPVVHGVHFPGVFARTPSSVNTSYNGTIKLKCQLLRNISNRQVGWRINGTLYSPKEFPEASVEVQAALSTLVITGVRNNMSIVCVAVSLVDPSAEEYEADPAEILLQGPLQPVINLTRNASTFLWVPPPSLDLTGVDSNIVYCVEVRNITCGRNDLIVSDCNVTESHYTADDIAPHGHIYKYIVTPRSNVEGALNGTPVLVKEEYSRLNPLVILTKTNNYVEIQIILFTLEWNSTPIVPTYFTLSLTPISHNLKILDNVKMNTTKKDDWIVLDVISPLPAGLWNYSIRANGCPSDVIVENVELSTHDIQNISVFSPLPGQVRVTGDFINGSTATGILASVHNESYVQYRRGSTSVVVEGLEAGKYNVSVFSIEEDDIPSKKATRTTNVTVTRGGNQSEPASIQYNIHTTSSGVCVNCKFLENSMATDVCLIIVQLNSGGLMNIESSHKFNRSGDIAHGCIEGVNLTHYLVGVVDGVLIQEKLTVPGDRGCTTECITGLVLVPVVLVVGVVLAIIIYWIHKCIKMKKRTICDQQRIQESHETESLLENYSDCEKGGRDNPKKMYVPPGPKMGHLTVGGDNQHGAPTMPPPPPPLPQSSSTTLSGFPRGVDDVSTLPVSILAAHESHEASVSDNGSSDEAYAQPVIHPPLNSVPPTPTTEKLIYDDIQRFQNQQGQLYALPQLKSTSNEAPDDLHQVVYSKVQTKPKYQSELPNADPCPEHVDSKDISHVPEPVTAERLFSYLLPLASKWLSLGEALSFDDDRLDEIFTNNETNQACLQEMLELYIKRSDLNHSWEEIKAAERKVSKERVIQVVDDIEIEAAERDSEEDQLPPEPTTTSLDNFTLSETPDSGHDSQCVSSEDHELEHSSSSILGDEATTESPDTQVLDSDDPDRSLAVDVLGSQQPGTKADSKDSMTELHVTSMYSRPVGSTSTVGIPPYPCIGEDRPYSVEDEINKVLTSTPLNGYNEKESMKSLSSPISLNLDDSKACEDKGEDIGINTGGSVIAQPVSHDIDEYPKVYILGTTNNSSCSCDIEPPSQGKTYNAIEDDTMTEISDEVTDIALSHGNSTQSYAEKLGDPEEANESGYITMNVSNNPEKRSTTHVEEYSSVNQSDVTGSEEPVITVREKFTLVCSSAESKVSEQAEGGSVSMYSESLSQEVETSETSDLKPPRQRCVYERFSTYIEDPPEIISGHAKDTCGHAAGHMPGKYSKNKVQDTAD